MTHEIRILAGMQVESRADAPRRLVGYAAVFDQETDIGGYFREVIRRGAFAEAIKRDDIHALDNHDYGRVIGRRSAGTLTLSEDDHGLKIEIIPPDTQVARDLIANIEARNIDQMSFSFGMDGGKQVWDETGEIPLRSIEKVGALYEVSIVPRGAYPTTEIGLRSLDDARKERRRANFDAARLRRTMKFGLDLRSRGI